MQAYTAAKHAYGRLLEIIESIFWRDDKRLDAQTQAFYLFVPFPEQLKREEKTDWLALQAKLFSPFQSAHHYIYSSSKGAHLWFATAPFNGIPETAFGQRRTNGQHHIASKYWRYEQTWQDGILFDCLAYPTDNTSDLYAWNKPEAWGVQKNAEKALKSPLVWTSIASLFFAFVLLFHIIGIGTIATQQLYVDGKIAKLNEAVGPKLILRDRLSLSSSAVIKQNEWHRAFSFVQIKLSKVLAIASALGDFVIGSLEWQEKTLSIEFKSENIDVTQLIDQLQMVNDIESVNLRPHNAAQTWVLEVKW